MNFDTDFLQQHIPYYLATEDRRVLLNELKAISEGGSRHFLLSEYHDSFKNQMLQGDGWRGFQLFTFETGERRSVKGLVLSNSCDIDLDNPRDFPTRVIFAPLLKLSKYEILLRSQIDKDRVTQKVLSIRAQKISNLFFLPAEGPLSEDYIVHLDHIHSMPVTTHLKAADREKLFTLSNTGFYMLVLKLSVHFCRLQENINRKDATAAI